MSSLTLENFKIENLDNNLERVKLDNFEKLQSFNQYFSSNVKPENGFYGFSETTKPDGTIEKIFKSSDGLYKKDYYYNDRLIYSRHQLDKRTWKNIKYDDNGTAYLEKIRAKTSNNALSVVPGSEHLLPNLVIKKDNVTTITDANGRVVSAKATDISLKNTNRESLHLDKTGKGYLETDQIGHLIPDSFNGKNTLENLVPQLEEVNLGKIKQVENTARRLKELGHTVDYEVKVNYGDSNNPNRPTSFEPKITVDGQIYDLDPSLKKIYNTSELSNIDKIKTTINEKVNTVKTTTLDAHGYGKEAALIAGGLTFVTSTTEDIKLVIDGQMDVDEMVVDIVQDTAMAGGLGYIEGFAESAICSAMRTSSNQMISGLAKTGIAGMVIDFGIKSYDSITDYAEGKIDELELMYDLGSNATTTVAAFEAAKLGATIGTGLGPAGTVAGGIVGGMVGYCIASEAYVAAVDAGITGVEFLGEKASELGNNCVEMAKEYIPEFANDIATSINEFASIYDIPLIN